ncbi:MAG: universal stress protein, partial [Planctomycetota bacterium]|nr:universal stress protein [Planctomycetota bacterium]
LSDRVIDHVKRLLKHEDAEVMFLRVLTGGVPGEQDRLFMDETETPRAHLQRLMRSLSEQGVRVRSLFSAGDPASQILTVSERYKPSLIAMTTHGRSGLQRWLRGSVAERVLRQTRFPLLLAHPGPSGRNGTENSLFRRILVPIDEVQESLAVLPLVRKFAKLNDSQVRLLHVHGLAPHSALGIEKEQKNLRRSFRPQQLLLENVGLNVELEIRHGVAAAEIINAIEEHQPDLVAMATHGRSGPSRWAFGSVAEKVIRHCEFPLLIQRTAKVARDPATVGEMQKERCDLETFLKHTQDPFTATEEEEELPSWTL